MDQTDEPLDFSLMIPAMDALSLLEPIVGGAVAAKLELADRLRDGRLLGYSREAWNSSKRNVQDAWRELPDENDPAFDVEYDIEVDTDVWRRSVQWQADQANWRWPGGRFSVVHRTTSQYARVMLDEMHFNKVAIEELLAYLNGGTAVPAMPIPRVSNTGTEIESGSSPATENRHSRGAAHALILLELLRLWETGELADPKFANQTLLAKRLEDLLRAKQPSVAPLKAGTIAPTLRIVLPALRDGTPCDLCDGYQFRPASVGQEPRGT